MTNTSALPAWRGSACKRSACFTPALLIDYVFVLTGGIGGRGRGRGHARRSGWTQEPEGQRRWDGRSGVSIRDRGGATIGATEEETRKTEAKMMTAAW